MTALRTVRDKQAELSSRKQETAKLGSDIDKLLQKQRDEDQFEHTGCGGPGLFPCIGRAIIRLIGSTHGAYVSTNTKESAPRGLFQKQSTEQKLATAMEGLRQRISVLETRISECRSSASESMKNNNKTAAMRELKRSKTLEKQLSSIQNVLDSMEAQSDLLEQTALQKQVASALGSSAKTLQKEKKILSSAESAVDQAAELRDLSHDLTDVLAGLEAPVDYDDDELLAELQGMVVDDEPPPVVTAKQEADLMEKKQAEFEEARRISSQMPKTPSNRNRKGGVHFSLPASAPGV
jgi:hypothetical protein